MYGNVLIKGKSEEDSRLSYRVLKLRMQDGQSSSSLFFLSFCFQTMTHFPGGWGGGVTEACVSLALTEAASDTAIFHKCCNVVAISKVLMRGPGGQLFDDSWNTVNSTASLSRAPL